MSRVRLAALVLLLLLPAAARAGEIMESKDTYESKGKMIAVERFEPKAPGKYPAVVLLHGSGGMKITGGGPLFRTIAQDLAKQGYVVVLPHYFDRTGTDTASLKEIQDNYVPWMETIREAVSYSAGRENVDAEKIGFLGFSLGGYLSLSTAPLDPRIKVVVEFFGGLPDALVDKVDKMPPVLILHGDADLVVPVKEAEKLDALLTSKKLPHETHIYKGAGHGFLGENGKDAMRRTTEYLDKYLRSKV